MAAEQRALVKAASTRTFFARVAGVRTSHIVGPADGAVEGITGMTEFAPAATVPLHWHNCEETVVVLEGEALFEAAGEQHALVAGDATWTPAGVPHMFSNRGRGLMRILWVYGRTDAARTLAMIGETSPIESEQPRP
jgi:putative monooxygenase